MDLLDILQNRRSIRSYTEEKIPDELITKVVNAGLLSASSRGIKPWELIVVRDKQTLERMAKCRVGSAKMLSGADCAIVVIADSEASDVWVEDCSIVMSNMHLMADYLGLGSCWIQGRNRLSEDNKTTEDYLREILIFPEKYKLEAILSLGCIENHPAPRQIGEAEKSKVHFEKYSK